MSQESPQRENPGLGWRMLQWLGPGIVTPLHVILYRLLGGRLVGGTSTLLLTTVGRRSGQPRTVTVGYLRDDDDVVMMDTNFAKPAVPAWVFNLRAHPEAEVRLGRERYQARAEFLEGEDRARQWDRQVAAEPLVDQAQRLAGREIDLIRLHRMKRSSEQQVDGGSDSVVASSHRPERGAEDG